MRAILRLLTCFSVVCLSFLLCRCENKETQSQVPAEKVNEQENTEIMAENTRERNEASALQFADTDFLKTKQPMSLDAIAPYDYQTGLVGDNAYNARVYIIALERAKKKLTLDYDTLALTIKSGAEIKIAEDLYQFIVWVIGTWNDWVREGRFEIIQTAEGYYDLSPTTR